MDSASPTTLRDRPVWRRKLAVLDRNDRIFPLLEIIFAVLLATMLVLAYNVVTGYEESGKLLPAVTAAALLVGNLVPAMALMVLAGRRMAKARAESSQSGSDGQLHIRLVALFSLVAAIPTLLVVIFASFLFQYGMQFWFSDNSRSLFENSQSLARGYYEQGLRDVSNQTDAMAGDLRDYLSQTTIDSPEFSEGYSYQLVGRQLSESAIIQIGEDGEPRTAAIAGPDDTSSVVKVTAEMIEELDNQENESFSSRGERILVSANADKVEAVTPIDREARIYLYVARKSDLLSYSQAGTAQQVLDDFDSLSSEINKLQFRFNLALLLISLLVVGIAVWAALRLADRMVRPLDELASAAREISTGNFSPRVDTNFRRDEVGVLARAFNRMAQRLETQTDDLVAANNQLDERRAFIEAILESVTAGIISVDEMGDVRLINSSAQQLLFANSHSDLLGQNIRDIGPAFAKLIENGETDRVIQYAVDSHLLTLAVKITREPIGHVITFEDITQQLLDQRQAAWSDVAQRIAHEIKNPLTPIQLATERLKKRYAKEVVSDPEIFGQLTETIIRQVGDLRNMVDEFSSFAKMPKPVFREENCHEMVRQAVFMHDVAHSDVAFELTSDSEDMPLHCDRRQIGQAITNIVKNAIESIEGRAKKEDKPVAGKILVNINKVEDHISITITDNGLGLPDEKDRITEPYMTTREKGTGLGLAIVKKIVEEHYGDIVFENAKTCGASVTLRFNEALLRQAANDSVAA